MADEQLLAPTFLFRFAAPCCHAPKLWNTRATELGDAYELPCFGELDGRPPFASLRAAWNKQGLLFVLRVAGKKQPPWCREQRIDDSDGLHLFVDTRDTHNIHRAGRFCHRFVFLPLGFGRRMDEPGGHLFPINRARESPKPIETGVLKIRSERRIDGYLLETLIPAAALTGFNPDDHPRLGFTYLVTDRELGSQTFTVGAGFPFTEDPSLWGTLELKAGPALS